MRKFVTIASIGFCGLVTAYAIDVKGLQAPGVSAERGPQTVAAPQAEVSIDGKPFTTVGVKLPWDKTAECAKGEAQFVDDLNDNARAFNGGHWDHYDTRDEDTRLVWRYSCGDLAGK
jgi:hypothetical protein